MQITNNMSTVWCNAEYGGALPWLTRVKILLGAAKGLEFLHKQEKPVIYRDFKPSNILLSSVIRMLRCLFCISIYLLSCQIT